jgi:hypothetical protein
MNLQAKYNEVMNSAGEQMISILAKLSEVESKYINAKMIIDFLKSDLDRAELSQTVSVFRTPEYIKQQITYWQQLVDDLESKQNLASC